MTEMSREEQAFRANPTAVAEAAAALRGEGLIEGTAVWVDENGEMTLAGRDGETFYRHDRPDGSVLLVPASAAEGESVMLRKAMQAPDGDLVEIDLER